MAKTYPYKVKVDGIYYKPGEPIPVKGGKTPEAEKSTEETKPRRKTAKE